MLALAASGTLVGCSDSPENALQPKITPTAVDIGSPLADSAAQQTDLAPGYVLHDGAQDGFQVALPDDWTTFGQFDIDLDQMMSEMDGTSFADIQDQVTSLFQQGGVLMA